MFGTLNTSQLAEWTAVFTTASGPGIAHVMSDKNSTQAWHAVAKRYSNHGQLVGLVPGHQPVVLQGALMRVQKHSIETVATTPWRNDESAAPWPPEFTSA